MPPKPETLRQAIAGTGASLFGRAHTVPLADLGRVIDADLTGAHVLLRTSDQLHAALALIALDDVAARIVICPPDVKAEHLPSVIERAAIDVVVSDDPVLGVEGVAFAGVHLPETAQAEYLSAGAQKTEWVLFTSGTTGAPKMVAHTLAGLTGAISTSPPPPRVQSTQGGGGGFSERGACDGESRSSRAEAETGGGRQIIWGTFYDIRRYGGLQIFLRALIGQASLILSDAHEDVADFLARLGRHGVTHLTGTPSHWRRVLMSPANAAIQPAYVRLSGEIADQSVLDSLKTRFPDAAMGHAYASTEAGVGFEVTDGREGFPAAYLDRDGPVRMKVVDGTLRIHSPRTASAYVGGGTALLQDGWVDTGDMIEQRGDRCYFAGRSGGIINVGGLKINPEEVEAIINRHPSVRASRVSGRKNPIMGAIVVAEIVANDNATLKDEILALCRDLLPAHKVPAMLKFVPELPLTAGGKLSRHA